jgi:predicted nucleic acid binding AN1-type Zn finger protein
MKKTLFVVAMLALGSTATFAQTAPAKKAEPKTEQKAPAKEVKPAAKAAVAMYECPMKCVAPSAAAGKCKKCGMDLVAVKTKSKSKKESAGHDAHMR